MDGPVPDHAAVGVPDLHAQGVEDHDGAHPVQCPGLPLAHLIRNGIGDPADQVSRNLGAVCLFRMGADIAHAKTGGMEPDDPVINAVDPCLTLPDKFGLETAIPITRHGKRHLAILALQALAGGAGASIGLAGSVLNSVYLSRSMGVSNTVTH